MGNSASAAEDTLDPFDGIDTLGYRVLGVQPDSPASKAGLVSFLDFLVGANGEMLLGSGEGLQEGEEYDDVDFPALLEEFKGKELELLVWNIKSQQQRYVTIVPDDQWGGAGLLGVTIRLDNYAGAEERLIRVLTVEPKSPAALAGLVPEKDFLLGTTHQTLESTSILARLLYEYQDKVVEMYVYNVDSDMVRTVALLPTDSWEGAGLLGAEVGIGYLHRLPHKVQTTHGSSIARKVRYIGTQPKKGEALLEMEPQLEMEVPEDEAESSADHDMNQERQSSTQIPNNETQQQQAQGTKETEQPTAEASVETATTREQSSAGEPATETKNVASSPTRATTGQNTSNQALRVFSQQPPGPLPPPPRRHADKS